MGPKWQGEIGEHARSRADEIIDVQRFGAAEIVPVEVDQRAAPYDHFPARDAVHLERPAFWIVQIMHRGVDGRPAGCVPVEQHCVSEVGGIVRKPILQQAGSFIGPPGFQQQRNQGLARQLIRGKLKKLRQENT